MDDFLWSKTKCVGARISGGDPRGVHEAGGRAQGGGRALHPRGHVAAPPAMFLVPHILKYSRKNHIKLAGHSRNFYIWVIFYCRGNSENRQNMALYFI